MDGLHAMVRRMTQIQTNQRACKPTKNTPSEYNLPNSIDGGARIFGALSPSMRICKTALKDPKIIEDAGHFAPCEQPQHTAASLVPFLTK